MQDINDNKISFTLNNYIKSNNISIKYNLKFISNENRVIENPESIEKKNSHITNKFLLLNNLILKKIYSRINWFE